MLAIVLWVACGDDDAPDAADDALPPPLDGANAAVVPDRPEEPAPAALPMLLPCMTGWAQRTSPEGVDYCDPYPRGVLDCDGDTMQLPGSDRCEPVGAACPSGDFPASLPVDRPVVYVHAGSSGDGTRSRPFGTIAQAVATAPEGATIAIAKGSYVETIVLDRSLDLAGACAAETILGGAATSDPAIAISGAHTVSLRDLQLGAADSHGVEVRDGATLTVDGCAFTSVRTGLTLLGATVRASRIVLRDVDVDIGGGTPLICNEASHCTFRDVVVYGARVHALTASSSEVDVERFAVLGDGTSTGGAFEVSGGRAAFRSIAIDHHRHGFSIVRSDATIDDSWLHSLRGEAFEVTFDGTLAVSRAVVDGAAETTVFGSGESFSLTDTMIRDTQRQWAPGYGAVVLVAHGTARLERVSIDGGEYVGVASYEEADLVARDLTIRNIRELDPGTGEALLFTGPADLERVRVVEAAGAAVIVSSPLADVHLRDLVVERSAVDSSLGIGIGVAEGEVELARARFTGCRTAGVVVSGGGARLTGTDVALIDTQPRASDADYGRAIDVSARGRLDLARVRIDGAFDHGCVAAAGANVHLSDVAIERIDPRACSAETCLSLPGGIGVGVYDSTVELNRFAVSHASLCGVHLDARASGTLRDGEIADSHVAVCLAGDHDIGALSEDVRFERNDENLNAVELPLPSPLPPLPPVPRE